MINDYEATVPMTQDRKRVPGTEADVDTDSIVSTLNNLVETCMDGHRGFTEAAEGVTNPEIKNFFQECSMQRKQFATELQSLVQQLGGEPSTSGSTAGALHRGWINIKSAVTGQDEAAILNECERGEDVAKNAYEETLDTFLPDFVRDVVQTQYTGVVNAHDKVKMFRDSFNNQTSSATSSN